MQLYDPINQLKPFGPEIWIADGPIVRMALYGAKVPFPTRMTLVQLENGGLWCHSPTELTPELKFQVDALGPVEHVVSPNKIHYAHIQAWKEAYPDASAWASPGVRDRANQQKIMTHFDADLDDNPPADWRTELDQVIFRGSRFMDEVVFFHRPSKTLILTDLIENFELNKVSPAMGILIRIGGHFDPDGKTPLDLRATFWGNKAQARVGLAQLLAWEPERIILAHGRCYEGNAIAELNRAFRWLS